MNRPEYGIPPEYRIPEDKAEEVFTLAAQLYAQYNQSYSVKELMEAGAEAKIPPEFIQQAIEELQLAKSSTGQPVSTAQNKKSKYLIGFAIGLPLLAAIAGLGWLLARNSATRAQVEQPSQPSIEQPSASQPPVTNFKCAKLNLTGQNLSGMNLSQADCTEANLSNANLSNTILQSSNLSKANLKNANLQGADLRGADLSNADLTNVDLSGAKLKGANLNKADLRGANLNDTNIGEADTAEAKLDGARK